MEIIKLENVSKSFISEENAILALKNINLTINQGEFVIIYGNSGGGKSTLLNIMSTLDTPSKGQIFICNQEINKYITDKQHSKFRLTKLGIVFQNFNLIPYLTAIENIQIPMILNNNKDYKIKSLQLIESVKMLQRKDQNIKNLSGGEQQRIAICRALANDPEILLLDEPTGDLDTNNCVNVMNILSQYHQKGITIVMITHDENLKIYADRIVYISDGKIVKEDVNKNKNKLSLDEKDIQIGVQSSCNDNVQQISENTFLRTKDSYKIFNI